MEFMTAKIDFFPVDNGDMALLTLDSGRNILIDVNIRKSADDEKQEEVIDVASLLKDKLQRDSEGRLYVDAFLLNEISNILVRTLNLAGTIIFWLSPNNHTNHKESSKDFL